MGRKKFVFKQKIVKISEVQQQKLDDLMNQGSFTSEADIWRAGLDLIHRKLDPPYLQDSPAASIKRKKIQKEKVFEAIPDEEFAKSNMEDIFIFTDEENKKWVLWRKIGNMVGGTPLEEIKNWVKSGDPEYNYHRSVAGQDHQPYEEELKDNLIRKTLNEHYGVAITYG